MEKIMSNFRSNARLLMLRLSAASALDRLKEYKHNLRALYISNEGISEEALAGMIIRDTEDCRNEVMDLLHKVRMEKSRLRMASQKKILSS